MSASVYFQTAGALKGDMVLLETCSLGQSTVRARFLIGIAFVFSASALLASTIQVTGSGSAVTTVNGAAYFESTNALNDNPYLEGGMQFSRTNLTFDNNSCGFAGCAGFIGLAGFASTGNYMYGTASAGGSSYFEIVSTGPAFTGLEFIVGTGWGSTNVFGVWETYDSSNALVGSGTFTLPVGSVVGFSNPAGFSRLRYSSSQTGPGSLTGSNAPAFDSVLAQTAVPEPQTISMMALGALALVSLRRRR